MNLENEKIIIQNINYEKIRKDILRKKRQKYRLKQKKRQRKYICRIALFSIALISGLSHYRVKKEESQRINREITIEIEQSSFLKPLQLKDIEPVQWTKEKIEINNLMSANSEVPQKEIEEESIMESVSFSDYLPSLGTNTYDEKYSYVENNYGEIVEKYAGIAGIDPRIIKCILAQERGVHSRVIDEGGAIGVAQIQVSYYLNSELTLHNYKTGEDETYMVTDELLKSLDGNIKVGTTLLQNHLKTYDGNLFLAVQAYNYGEGATNRSIRRASQKYGYSIDYIINDPTNLFWIDGVKQFSQEKNGYGDADYLDHVFSRYPGNDLQIMYYNDNQQRVLIESEQKIARN